MTRLLVHLHLYYQEQLPWFVEKLANLEEPWDLVVTMPEGNAEARFKISGVKAVYACCNRHGLFLYRILKQRGKGAGYRGPCSPKPGSS